MTKEAASEHSHSDGGGDLVGCSHSSDRFLGDHSVPALGGAAGEPVHHLGVDDAGADGVDADVRRRVVECGVLGQADHAVLRGGVGGSTSEGLDAGAGGGVHDRAAPVLQHQRDLVLHAQEHAAEVDGDDPVPFLLGDIGGRAGLLFGAGVVEGDVETPERARLPGSAQPAHPRDRVTSQRTASARPPSSSIMRAVSWLPWSDRSASTTLAPSRAKARPWCGPCRSRRR